MTEPTDWVNSMVVSRKANGKLRVCLDPKDLNKAIKRCHHKTPTLDEITYKLAGAKFFTKMDGKNSYWSMRLDDESSLLTTFNTPSDDTHGIWSNYVTRRASTKDGPDTGKLSRYDWHSR